MKKIPINFEYHLPERSEFYKMSKKEAKEVLENERKRFESYLEEAESEINSLVTSITRGTNLVEDDLLLTDENSVDYGESQFAFIGEKNQNKIVQINNLYKEIQNGIHIYQTISNNEIFSNLNKEVILKQGVFPDVAKFNRVVEEMNFNFEIDYRNLLKDIKFYDNDVALLLKTIESQRVLRIIERQEADI